MLNMEQRSSIYLSIKNYIKDRIKNEKLKVGDKLETEAELTKKFNVSRTTVNKALSLLAAEGLVERIPGRGTFVHSATKNVAYQALGIESMTSYIESQNKKPGSILVDFEIFKAKERPSIMEKLQVGENDYIYYFSRIRTADDEPVVYSISYVPAKRIPPLSPSQLEHSFYQFLNENGIARTGYKSTVSAILASKKIAEYLRIAKGDAIMLHQHTIFTEYRIPLEYSEVYYIGSKYSFEYEGYDS